MSAQPPTVLDPAGVGAGSLAAASSELIGPLATAAVPRPLTLQPSTVKPQAQAVVDVVTRRPLVLVTLLRDLTAETLTISTATQVGTAPVQTQPVVTFAPYTAAGTALVAAVPTTDA